MTTLQGHVVSVLFTGQTWGWVLGAAINGAEYELEQNPDQPIEERRKTAFLLGTLRQAMAIGAPATLDESLAEADDRIAALALGGPLDDADRDLITKLVQRVAGDE